MTAHVRAMTGVPKLDGNLYIKIKCGLYFILVTHSCTLIDSAHCRKLAQW
uniref:Uncharacterized protein n=1 Tax=Candidatus Kentrum sp. UNK TaxID=2126344 RepID=A0A451B448_9GAMM|nr:MAG: hypothetical protein BECKUNK1418G_GA0071005_12873 [Candidatus Kentron sp. UNK]VFK73069.1 MAG: hypothetical protein BECKUNK1418H_GA0071006_11609 [Candidatus Kentron sp. UNK]